MAPVATPSDCNETTTWVQLLAGKNVVPLGTKAAVCPTAFTVAWIWSRRPVLVPGLTKNLARDQFAGDMANCGSDKFAK